MKLLVKGPEKILFDDTIYGFQAKALDGDLVCLDHHIDYLSVIQKGPLTLLDEHLKPFKTIDLDDNFILTLENNQAVLFR